jgi:4'-phosphopantetheinyl transferase
MTLGDATLDRPGRLAVGWPGATPIRLVWCLTRVGAHAVLAARADVDPATAARADAMAHPGDRRRILVAHALLRREVAPGVGVAPSDVRIARHCGRCGSPEHGRPVLEGTTGPAAQISLSHAGDLAILAVADQGLYVGVDAEPVDRSAVPRLREGLELFMSASERAQVRAADDPVLAMVRSWTGQEAVAKATGLGLGDELLDVDIAAARSLGDGWWAVARHPARVAFPFAGPSPARGRVRGAPTTDRSTFVALAVIDARGDRQRHEVLARPRSFGPDPSAAPLKEA